MSAHTRFALPVNTHSNLKYLHNKAQDHDDKTDNQTATVTPHRDSKFSRKMKMLFPGKTTKAQSTPEEQAAQNERKRSTMSRLVGSHASMKMSHHH